jgi:hypothetical protein
MTRFGLALLLCLISEPAARAVEHVVMRQNDEEVALSGRLVATPKDAEMLLLTADGTLWAVPPEDLLQQKHDDVPMLPLSPQEMGERLKGELPGFDVYTTQHYVICHNTSRAYAQWCGALLERLYKAFTNFWSRKDFELHEPEFPLVALVFADADSYAAYTSKELGANAAAMSGYYSFSTNRVSMYDLTGMQALRAAGNRRSNASEINQMLARPEAERNVATIIHEATHQIAFNCGLQQRYAPIPRWFSEGMGIYFETPDLSSSKGWRTIGAVNRVQQAGFRRYLQKGRPADSLTTLLLNDERLYDRESFEDAYSESWALTYFLMRYRPKQYLAYLKLMAEKKPLVEDGAKARLRDFQQVFGDLSQLDAEFVKQMQKLR